MKPIQIAFFHLAIRIEGSLMSFHGLIAHFFFVLNNFPLSGYTTAYLSIHLLKGITVASKFRQLWIRLYKRPCAGFYVDISFQLIRVFINTKERKYQVERHD